MLRLELSWFLISSRSLCRPWGSVVGDCKEGWPAFSMIALVCTNSYIRPQNPGQDLLLTWLATRPQSSKLLKSILGNTLHSLPCYTPFYPPLRIQHGTSPLQQALANTQGSFSPASPSWKGNSFANLYHDTYPSVFQLILVSHLPTLS